MNNPWPALAVAVALVAIGASWMASHVADWRRQQADPTLEERDLVYYRRRYRRRMQISAVLAILGVLIGAGDALLPFQKKHPLPTTLYWIGVLSLTGWVILLAGGDFWSTLAYGRAELARMRQKRRELERQVVEFKERNLNGHGFDDGDHG